MNGRTPTLPLSVVIAAHNAAQSIGVCLSALTAQVQPDVAEIIVADSSTDGTAGLVREQFPSVHLLHFDEAMNLPQLRGRGIATARGEIIAILDPYSVVGNDWVVNLLQAHDERPNLIIGGTVDLYQAETQDLWAWAAYINEYGMFMRPLLAGEMEILPGSNISYKRAALFDDDRPKQAEFWKTFANWDAEAAGSALWQSPDVVVHLHKPIPFADFLRTRFAHGRCFAGMRVANAKGGERLLRVLTTPLLPFLFLWRWGRRYWAKKRFRSKFLLTLPLQFILFSNWALGEFIGYLRGPGQTCRQLFY